MTLQEAIVARHSVRQYQKKPIEAEIIKRLNEEIALCNQEGKLHIQLVTDEPKAFAGGMAKYGKFSGVSNYLAMVGPKGADEAVGYYGERLVLLAQTLGLNSCWVGLTYKKIPGAFRLREGDIVHCVIAIGYGETQGVKHKIKRIDQVSNVSNDSPEWFRRGVEAALLAPTAINQQKFSFELLPTEESQPARVLAKRHFSLVGYTQMDLGIARYHFEIGAGKENFLWA